MNLRRERTHQMGTSNLVYHPGPSTPKDEKKTSRISFTSLKKGKKATDVIEKRVSRGLLSPITTTQDMYKSAGKLLHSKTMVGYPRMAQLEEKEKRKLVFTGESFLIYDKILEKYRDLDVDIHVEDQAPTRENLAKEKHNIYGTAVHETQLVGYDKHSADTLKNNVNLEKVREARRVLRRRYASRKNMYSIYNAWDEDNKGVVSIDDVYNMSKKLGLNLNVDEARVLLASANKTGTGELSLDEFLDLIYNKDDVLNVDLEKLSDNLGADYLVKREELERGDDNLLRKLEEDAKRTREIKHMNQTNLILKNHLHEINTHFLEADPNHVGYVNYEKFEEVLKKLAINENVVSNNDIKSLFEKHRAEGGHTINYKSFLTMLKDFVFQYEDAYKEQKPTIKRAQSINTFDKKEDENEFHIVDCRTLPYHSIIEYWTRTKKVNRAIKRFFPNKKDFYSYLGGALHVEKDQVAERYVSGKELKSLVDALFHNFDDGEVEKRDFEGFLSSCVYNKQGNTNLGEVAKLVYDEEESEFFHKINFKKKGPGPRKDDAESNLEDIPENKTLQFANEKRTLIELPNIGNTIRDETLDRLLQKVDNTFFVGTKKAYEAFRAFDIDKDGYISRKDLAKKINEMAIMTPEEGQRVLDYVDPENKGFVNFQEFSSKIRPNMAQQDEKGGYTVLPFVTSSKEALLRTTKTVPNTTETVKRMIASVQPENAEQRAKTRYNANPSWNNTFLTFQANSKSPMFLTESERFNRDPHERVKFQHDAFQKKKEFEDGRLRNKQKFAAFFSDRIEQESNALDRLDENRRAKKYMQQVRYEQRAKLFNSYV